MSPLEGLALLRRVAEAAHDEADDRQPRDWDALSPKAARTSELHALLTPEAVLALVEWIDTARGNHCPGCDGDHQ